MQYSDELARCVSEYGMLLQIANFALWVAVISATVITILTVVERIVAFRKTPTAEAAGGGADVGTLLDSLKGLVTALAAAPAWFAILLAGVLLLWCAGKFTPAECHKQLETVEHAASTNESGKAQTDKR